MRVRIQILDDWGKVIVQQEAQAFDSVEWVANPGEELVHGVHALVGYEYKPQVVSVTYRPGEVAPVVSRDGDRP